MKKLYTENSVIAQSFLGFILLKSKTHMSKKRKTCKIFLHTSNTLYFTSEILKLKKKIPKQKYMGWKVNIIKARFLTQTLQIQVTPVQKVNVYKG